MYKHTYTGRPTYAHCTTHTQTHSHTYTETYIKSDFSHTLVFIEIILLSNKEPITVTPIIKSDVFVYIIPVNQPPLKTAVTAL